MPNRPRRQQPPGVEVHKVGGEQFWVSADDVAALITDVAVQPNAPSLIEFGGPEAISRNQAILVAEELTGRKMKRQSMRTRCQTPKSPNVLVSRNRVLGLKAAEVPRRHNRAAYVSSDARAPKGSLGTAVLTRSSLAHLGLCRLRSRRWVRDRDAPTRSCHSRFP